uniref:Brother of CDO n=1 Tax=Scleropages formosus TaxID=113540 RepID=A0A8C9TSZ0_SCLFO
MFINLNVALFLPGAGEVPVFTEEPLSVVQKLGGRVTLHCGARPAAANVSWRLNGQELALEDLGELGIQVRPGLLVISALANLTLGRYQCVARTGVGAVASVPANVTAAKLRDFEPDDQQEIEVDEGNTAVIECHLPESQPKAEVRYSVKQEWLETSKGNYLIMPSGNLQIVNATQEDEGTYKCAAYNPVTQEVKTSSSTDRLRIRRSPSEGARIIYPPASRSIMVTKGQRLVLECVASGTPPPQVTWAKDGLDLRNHNNTRFLLSNLLIDAASEADSGTYSCRADNGVGEPGSASILYDVQVFEPPQVRVELQQQAVSWGSSVRFGCLARGKPTPSVVWLHNARPLSPSPRHRLSARVLRVLQVGPQDDGVYQCLAENDVGSAQAATHILRPTGPEKVLRDRTSQKPGIMGSTVAVDCAEFRGPVSPAEAPVILSQPRTGKADLYELTWKPRHDGGAPVLEYVVKYRKAGDPSEGWTTSHISGLLHKLTLVKLDPASLYEVEMAARNCAGLGQPAMMTFRTGKGVFVGVWRVRVSTEDVISSYAARMVSPEAPDRPTVSTASETSAYVTWIPRGNRGFPIQSFRVEFKKLKKGEDWALAVSNIPPSRLSVEIAGLAKGTSYKFRVRAVNVLGESTPSAPSKAYAVVGSGHGNTKRPVNGPYITYNEAINETTIILKWTYTPQNNTPIYGFYIFYRPTDSDNDSDYKKDVVEGDRYWHSITDLQPETAYDIKMQCFNEGGESEFGNVVILETKARKQPRPLTTEAPVQRTEHSGGPIPRPSDLPYLIVGVVLGTVVFLIVASIPFCLWRSWAKQKQTSDLCFQTTPISSCQYTMVPLQGLALIGHCPMDPHPSQPQADHPPNGKHSAYCLPGLHQVSSLSVWKGLVDPCPSNDARHLPDNSTQQLFSISHQPAVCNGPESKVRRVGESVAEEGRVTTGMTACSRTPPPPPPPKHKVNTFFVGFMPMKRLHTPSPSHRFAMLLPANTCGGN